MSFFYVRLIFSFKFLKIYLYDSTEILMLSRLPYSFLPNPLFSQGRTLKSIFSALVIMCVLGLRFNRNFTSLFLVIVS